MSTPYVGEIRLFSYPNGRVPSGWFACDGSLKSIADYDVLFTLIGTTYGGDGVNTFAVPDLRGRVPVHQGNGPGLSPRVLGQMSGLEAVTLNVTQLPAHTHALMASTQTANSASPGAALQWASISNDTMYASDTTGSTTYALAPSAVTVAGGNQAHNNLMPTLAASYAMAWQGIFPSQS